MTQSEYQNPILCADYSDPDIVRVGDDFFMVSSSFNHMPALPILHSTDLVNWQIINHVFDADAEHGVAGVTALLHKGRIVLIADTLVHEWPDEQDLANIAERCAEALAVPLDELAAQTSANTKAFFQLA